MRTSTKYSGSRFRDREDAGRQLGQRLAGLHLQNAMALGLPRGGVPVAAAVAAQLDLPLDVIVVRKLGLPANPEVAMGAVAEGDVTMTDDELIARAGVSADEVAAVIGRERATVGARLRSLRGGRDLDLRGRTALVIDDGIATGATASVASLVAMRAGAERVVVAAPVCNPRARAQIRGADDVVCLVEPPGFDAVGRYYDSFPQTTDAEVARLLARAHHRTGLGSWMRTTSGSSQTSVG